MKGIIVVMPDAFVVVCLDNAHVNHFYEAPEIANQFVADTCLRGY